MEFKWFNNYEIIAFENWCNTIISIRFFDLNFKPRMTIGLRGYELWALKHYSNVKDNIIYLWYAERILIINGYNVVEIRVPKTLIMYNQKHDLFIDFEYNLYRLNNNKLVLFKFEYDIWNDDNKPKQIKNIIATFIDLDILPNEIHNIIYQYLVSSYVKKIKIPIE